MRLAALGFEYLAPRLQLWIRNSVADSEEVQVLGEPYRYDQAMLANYAGGNYLLERSPESDLQF